MHVNHLASPRPMASFGICALVCREGIGSPCRGVLTSIPFASSLGVRTWPPRPLSPNSLQCRQTPCVILGAPALLSMGRVPRGEASLSAARAQAHMPAACVPHPHPRPRWSLPGQLSCLPHASAAPRTGPCENPAGKGASKPGSSWDAWGHWGVGGVILPWRPGASVHAWGGAA